LAVEGSRIRLISLFWMYYEVGEISLLGDKILFLTMPLFLFPDLW
jgi:hypothetical protein